MTQLGPLSFLIKANFNILVIFSHCFRLVCIVTELGDGRIAVRYVEMETNSDVVLDISRGFATGLTCSAVGILLQRIKRRVSYLLQSGNDLKNE